MLKDETSPEMAFPAPMGRFTYLDTSRMIKTYHELKQSYLVVRKDGTEHHVLAFDHKTEQMIIKEEVKGILKTFYPIYDTLMSETFHKEHMDFEKVSYGIALGMKVYEKFKESIVHFRFLHSFGFLKRNEHFEKLPLGDPDIPKDEYTLGCIFQTYERKGKNMFTYDGYVFPEEVMDILLFDSQVIGLCPEPKIYKGVLSDVWKLRGKP